MSRPAGASARQIRSSAARVALGVCVAVVLGGALSGCTTPTALRWHPLAGPTDSNKVVGELSRHRIAGQDTLIDLTRPNGLGYVELLAANPGVDAWVPGEGTRVVLPSAHLVPLTEQHERPSGIVINLADQRLYVFTESADKQILSFPIGVSRDGFSTPMGKTRVIRKREAPIWYPTASARREDPTLEAVVAAGPENPLGNHALYLDWPQYIIHGTNEPDGVGRRVSRGCIRLYPEHIEQLYAMTPIDTNVQVVHQPVKLARVGRHIFLEVHPTMDEMQEIEETGALSPVRPEDLRPRIRRYAGAEVSERVDWSLAYQTAAERRGIPVQITR